LVDVGADHPLAKVVEDAIFCAAAKVPERFLMQSRPHLAARLPHHFAERAARILQGHNEQARSPIAPRRCPGGCALAVIDLGLLAREMLQAIELLRLTPTQTAAEALDTAVAMGKPVAVDQLLIDRGGVSTQPHLRFDPSPMRFAGRARVLRRPRLACRSRWPGWGTLPY